MAGPIVFISHQRVKPERFDEFAAFFAEGSKAIEADKPGTVVFLAFTDLERGETRIVHVFPDAAAMDRVNPIYIPRNHLVEEALDAATAGDLAPFSRLLDAVTQPFDERPGFERYAEPAPDSFGRYRTYCGT